MLATCSDSTSGPPYSEVSLVQVGAPEGGPSQFGRGVNFLKQKTRNLSNLLNVKAFVPSQKIMKD